MSIDHTGCPHVLMTETLLRLYVLLGQQLDRCLDAERPQSCSEEEFERHFQATRASVGELLAVNPVVQAKMERECQVVLALVAPAGAAGRKEELLTRREGLRHKMLVLSDLLAVFRADRTSAALRHEAAAAPRTPQPHSNGS